MSRNKKDSLSLIERNCNGLHNEIITKINPIINFTKIRKAEKFYIKS